MTVCTRFAPSPTGYLHVGGVRTALYCWLYARKHNGKFILRIEDTDRERSTLEAVDAIIASMEWLGLDWDEGPFYQTQRFERYREVIQQLLADGKAYRCYCSKDRLESLRAQQMSNKEKPRYDGHCRGIKPPNTKSPYVVRFANPVDGIVSFNDAVRGSVAVQNAEMDDLIIARTDGTPTYNFTVVVDDIDMGVTVVIRGADHITNTPRQINIFHALNAATPQFAHVPMILGHDGKRLSKRHGAVSVLQYREDGFLPHALLNYLVRLGWSHGDQEIFSIAELKELFDINSINKAPAAFNMEKLLWLNQHYLKTLPVVYVAKQLAVQFEKLKIAVADGPDLEQIVLAQRERAKTLVEMAAKSRFFYEEFQVIDPQAAKKHLQPAIRDALQAALDEYASLTNWETEAIHQVIIDVAARFSLKLGKLAQPIRVAVTGNTVSPPLDVTLKLIGKGRTLARLTNAIGRI